MEPSPAASRRGSKQRPVVEGIPAPAPSQLREAVELPAYPTLPSTPPWREKVPATTRTTGHWEADHVDSIAAPRPIVPSPQLRSCESESRRALLEQSAYHHHDQGLPWQALSSFESPAVAGPTRLAEAITNAVTPVVEYPNAGVAASRYEDDDMLFGEGADLIAWSQGLHVEDVAPPFPL